MQDYSHKANVNSKNDAQEGSFIKTKSLETAVINIFYVI